ncbi:MAG: GDSL-type esterase/lipase family protein [bacterium]
MKHGFYFRMLKTFAAIFVAVFLLAGCGSSSDVQYYVALGDSLSVGYQPDASGVNHVTDQGYPDQIYAALLATHPNLQLVKLGCPGETIVSMANGGICPYDAGSQIKQAVEFLLDHQDQVILVTIDIGVNDLLSSGCIQGTTIDQACIQKALQELGPNLSFILSKLFGSVDRDTPVIGMNYYNTFLAAFLAGRPDIAQASDQLAKAFNQQVLAPVYQIFSFPVADVAGKFQISDFTPVASAPLPSPPFPPQVPNNLKNLCLLTYMCVPPPQGPNIHANPNGYGVIAKAFLDVIGTLTLKP